VADLSVVVCTHERPRDLAGCLDALAATGHDLEVIVVDSASRRPCRDLVEQYREMLPALRYRYVAEPGLSRARNAGIAAAGGDIVAFIDDDASPQPGWDDELRRAFAQHPRAGCVGGACVARFGAERPRWLSERLLQFSSITRWGEGARQPRSSAEWPFGANMAFRAAALAAAGEFSLALGRIGSSLLSGEDSDMVARVIECGWEVWLEPGAAVLHTVHADRCRSSFYWRRLWWAGVSRATTPSLRASTRLAVAAPIRLALWLLTGDRFYLYRTAESAGYFLTVLRGAAVDGG
jgi:glycosyltransferase involved in cell wall biosynthesis